MLDHGGSNSRLLPVWRCIDLNLWFTETENSNLAVKYHIKKVLAHKDQYQELLVVETERFGRTLI